MPDTQKVIISAQIVRYTRLAYIGWLYEAWLTPLPVDSTEGAAGTHGLVTVLNPEGTAYVGILALDGSILLDDYLGKKMVISPENGDYEPVLEIVHAITERPGLDDE